uniref:CRC domain-containing protein n=2 Tax=Clytia hemisphaerica TaxID=252671 RepID=A0A7M5XML4_9CNID
MEIEKLKKHINLGCCSDIPPGGGTNKNENLHKQLKCLVCRGKMKTETATAIFSHLFYIHNSKKNGEKYVHPIFSKGEPRTLPGSASTLVINKDNKGNNVAVLAEDILEVDSDRKDNAQEQISCVSKMVVVLGSVLEKINAMIPKDLSSRLYRYQGFDTLITEIWNPLTFFQAARKMESFPAIAEVLKLMNLHIIETAADDCNDSFLFTIFKALKGHNLKCAMDIELKPTFEESREEIINNLLHEANGVRCFLYDSLIESDEGNCTTFLSENKLQFLQCVLPLIAANAFSLPILVIPSCHGMPMFPILPEEISNELIFVFYDITMSSYHLLTKHDPGKSRAFCRCGTRIKKKEGKSEPRCINPFMCSCKKENVPCSSKCTCRNCDNAKTPLQEETKQKRRKRSQYFLSKSSVNEIDHQSSTSHINGMHHYILEACLHLMLKEMHC